MVLSSWPVVVTPPLMKLLTPQLVGNIRLNRNAQVSCLYQVWNLRGIKCKCQGAGLSHLTVSGFLLSLTTPAAAQGGSWVLDFHH